MTDPERIEILKSQVNILREALDLVVYRGCMDAHGFAGSSALVNDAELASVVNKALKETSEEVS